MGSRRGGWGALLLIGLPAVTGFAELSLQNHLLGDAGHLAVGHCVGSVPAGEKKNHQSPHRRTLAPPPPRPHSLLEVGSVLRARLVLFGEEKGSPPVTRVLPGEPCGEKPWRQSGPGVLPVEDRNQKQEFSHTWVMGNDLARVLRTAAGAAAGGRTEAP